MSRKRGVQLLFVAKFIHAVLNNWFGHKILLWILEYWRVNDKIDVIPDAVMITSYAAREDSDELTNGSLLAMSNGLVIAGCRPKTPVAWGTFGPARSEVEEVIKKRFFEIGNLEDGPVSLPFGKVTSSTDEADAGLEILFNHSKKTDREIKILLVSSEACHSRRQRMVWKNKIKKYFPEARLLFISADAWAAADPKNPMAFQKYVESWLVLNLILGAVYKIPILLWLFNKLNFHQPVAAS